MKESHPNSGSAKREKSHKYNKKYGKGPTPIGSAYNTVNQIIKYENIGRSHPIYGSAFNVIY